MEEDASLREQLERTQKQVTELTGLVKALERRDKIMREEINTLMLAISSLREEFGSFESNEYHPRLAEVERKLFAIEEHVSLDLSAPPSPRQDDHSTIYLSDQEQSYHSRRNSDNEGSWVGVRRHAENKSYELVPDRLPGHSRSASVSPNDYHPPHTNIPIPTLLAPTPPVQMKKSAFTNWVAFVNINSGGKCGPAVLKKLRRLLPLKHVYDLVKDKGPKKGYLLLINLCSILINSICVDYWRGPECQNVIF